MLKTIKDADIEGKSAIVRVDFNVPVDDKGNIVEDDRIAAAIPTIKFLVEKNCKVILMSHLGRPEGKVVEGLRMDGVAKRLSQLLGKDVKKLDDCVGSEVEAAVREMKNRDVVLLENLRFHAEEEVNDGDFAKSLASLAEIYVNDAFAASHRAHTSVVGIVGFLPSYAGLLLEREVRELGSLLEKPARPFIAVLGGAKVSDKIMLISNLLKRADRILLAGAMAFTFLKAEGCKVGRSKVENDFLSDARKLLESKRLVLPVDIVAADRFDNEAKTKTVAAGSIPDGWLGLDIGPETLKAFSKETSAAKTILWNGPAGVFELEKFSEGTRKLAGIISESKAASIVGGGDTIAAVKKFGLQGRFSYVSTGGGAMLEFLEGKKLPAIAALGK